MQTLKLRYLFLFAVLMVTAKPFIGFSLHNNLLRGSRPTILVKAFAKRKQEYRDDSEFNIVKCQKQLNDPVIPYLLLFSCLLDLIFKHFVCSSVLITNRLIDDINLNLFFPLHRYLLNGKLII